MITIVWEFIVRDDAVAAFQRVHGPAGEWVALFRAHPGYAGTTLLQDTTNRERFLTIDRWESESRFGQMRRRSQLEYARLDALCQDLTVSERLVGMFSEVP